MCLPQGVQNIPIQFEWTIKVGLVRSKWKILSKQINCPSIHRSNIRKMGAIKKIITLLWFIRLERADNPRNLLLMASYKVEILLYNKIQIILIIPLKDTE